MQRLFSLTLYALLLSILLFAFYVFATSGTVVPSKAGETVASISGWTISNINYDLAKERAEIGAVEFDLDGPAHSVLISFDAGQERSFPCYNTNSYHWKCEVENVKVARVGSLRIIAVD